MSREDWEAFEAHRKQRQDDHRDRREKFREYFDRLALANHGWRCCHYDTHYQYTLLGDTLDFWPGPGKFRWRGKTRTGLVFKFIKEQEASK